MLTEGFPEEYLDQDSVDLDKEGKVVSGVVMGKTWADVVEYRLKNSLSSSLIEEHIGRPKKKPFFNFLKK